MPRNNSPVSGSKSAQILELLRQGISGQEITRRIGCSRGTIHDVMKRYGPHGGHRTPDASGPGKAGPPEDYRVDVPVDDRDGEQGDTTIVTAGRPRTLEEMQELFKIDPRVWVATHLKSNVWQGFYKVKGPGAASHQTVPLFQTSVSWKRIMSETVELMLLDFFREHAKPAALKALPRPARVRRGEGQMVSWGLWDAHLGLYAWQAEVGANMDLTTAVNRVTNSIDDMARELAGQPIEKIVMPIGNDFMHYDQTKQKTTHGEHHLDCDTRYGKVYVAGLQCLCYMIERARELCDDVEVIYVPGNHDLVSSYTLCVALSQRFINARGVTFDISPNPRKYRQFGGTLLGFNHGDGSSAQQLSLIFSTECVKEWSSSTYREVQIGHTHQRREKSFDGVVPTNGVTIRTNPCLSNVDMWHHKQGLIGEPVKSVEAWRYDRVGYRGSHCTWARDETNDRARAVEIARGTS